MSKNLLKSTAVVGGMTFISRVLGFVRDMVAAHFFGASPGYDAFIVASKIPNFMRRLFAEGAFSQAFVPILSEYRAQQPFETVQQLVNRVFGCLTMALVGVTTIGILFAPMIVRLFAPGFMEGGIVDPRLALASEMLTITFPYLLFISLTAFAGGILNCHGRFAVPAITPVFLNILMILAVIVLAPHLNEPVTALAWGMLGGGIVQLLFQVPFLRQVKLFPRPAVHWRDPGVRRILGLMTPALFGVSVNQLNLMLSSVFASFLPVGSVSWLYYAERLMEFPVGGIGVALATVVLPRLSRYHANAEPDNFSATLDWGVRWVMVVGLPAALGLALLSGPLLATLFQSGKFNDSDVLASQSALIAYAASVIGFMLVKIFASAYYAQQDVKTPVRMAAVTVVANAVLSVLLIRYFLHAGLAWATSLAALLNAGLLGFGLLKQRRYQPQPGWKALGLQLMFALSAMSLVIFYASPDINTWFALNHLERIGLLLALMAASGLVYIGALLATGLRPRHLLAQSIPENTEAI